MSDVEVYVEGLSHVLKASFKIGALEYMLCGQCLCVALGTFDSISFTIILLVR